MMRPQKILFVIPSLQGGGAERVVCSMANKWTEQGREVTIVTLSGSEEPVAYSLLPAVRREHLSVLGKSKNALADNMERIRKIRSVFKAQKPDVVLSFMETTNVLSLLAARGLGVRVVVSDRVDPKHHSYGLAWRILRDLTYPFASSFVVQTKAVLDRYPSFLHKRAGVIPNFVGIEGVDTKQSERRNVICAMGRLETQKGFDVLIRSFAKIADQFPAWSIEIRGEGGEKETLEAMVKELNLSGRVAFPVFTKDVSGVLSQAGVFVLSSRYEGFPNALMEAMACGAPVISMRCPYGPEELIENEENGILVPVDDVDALADALARMMEDDILRERLGLKAREIATRYAPDTVLEMWEDIICAA